MADRMQWTNALSTQPSLEAAIAEAVDGVRRALPTTPDLAIITIASAYASEYARLVPLLRERLPVPALIGCGGSGIIGTRDGNSVEEIEDNPALSLTAACLPGVEVQPFHIGQDAMPDLDSGADAWTRLVDVAPERQPQLILLADPLTAQTDDLLEGLDFVYPGSRKVGGLASAAAMGRSSGLFCYDDRHPNDPLRREGTVGVALSGNITMDAIVAQGCRPVGPLYQVTQGERNRISTVAEVGGEGMADAGASPCSPLAALREFVPQLSEADQQLAQTSLFVGIARNEFKSELEQGDFLIRTLMGVDPNSGAVAIGDRVRPGQRIRFHLRDARTSAEDLELLLSAYRDRQNEGSQAAGALLFSCLGRGRALYGEPNVDSQLFCRYLNRTELGGFFCNGEIGPVGDRTFIHGYTSSFAIFREPDAARSA